MKKLINEIRSPKRYYETTRNIPEMKLKMLNEGVFFAPYSYYANLFEKSNKDIEDDLSLKFKRNPNVLKDKGAMIYSDDDHFSEKLSYRKIELQSDWNDASEWFLFFWKLGEFVENNSADISIFISYVSVEIPALLSTATILDSRYRGFKEKYLDSDVIYSFQPGDKISYLNDSKKNKWDEAEVIKVEFKENNEAKFNPYLTLKISGSKNRGSQEIETPRHIWETKIRKGGVTKGVGGRGTGVKLNDIISEKISDRYGENTLERLKVTPRCHVNLIGRRINSYYRVMRESIQLLDDLGSFLLTDLLYFDNDDESNFINVHVVSSDRTNITLDKETVSIFVGAKSAIDFPESKVNKNIYLTSREKSNLLEDNEILINILMQETKLIREERLKKEKEFRNFLESSNILIPRGVEFSVF